MTRSTSGDLIQEDPEIERTINRIRRTRAKEVVVQGLQELGEEEVQSNPQPQSTMAEEYKTISDYTRPSLTETDSSVLRPPVAANNFEIKPNTIQMV